MPGSSTNVNNSSFIPKRGPARRRSARSKGQVFIFSIITYSLLFASLLAAAGTFLYKNYLESQIAEEVTALNESMATFRVADLLEVREFEHTLKQATDRINNLASVVAVLDTVDKATVGPVQLESLTIERAADDRFMLSGSVLTTSLDAAMFQRKIYSLEQQFADVVTQDVTVSDDTVPNGATTEQITFEATLNVPLSEMLYDPQTARLRDQLPSPAPTAVTAPVATVEATTTTQTSEPNTI